MENYFCTVLIFDDRLIPQNMGIVTSLNSCTSKCLVFMREKNNLLNQMCMSL